MITVWLPACKMSATFKTADGALAFLQMLTNKINPEQFANAIGHLYGSEFATAAHALAITCLQGTAI